MCVIIIVVLLCLPVNSTCSCSHISIYICSSCIIYIEAPYINILSRNLKLAVFVCSFHFHGRVVWSSSTKHPNEYFTSIASNEQRLLLFVMTLVWIYSPVGCFTDFATSFAWTMSKSNNSSLSMTQFHRLCMRLMF